VTIARIEDAGAGWFARGLGSLQSSSWGLVALALAIGAGAGAGAVAFRYLILGFTLLFTGHRDYSSAGHAPYGYAHGIGFWFVVVTPIVGGLLYGPLIYRYAREARGHGVPEVMLAVSENGGRIRPQVAVVKSLASALCIGSGGSVGREGPIVQIGSALGSTLGQWTRMPESRLRILVACGAAGGISATFNAPIAGVFFALELILRDFEADAFGVVVLSSFVADIIGRAAFGSHAFLDLPALQLQSAAEYPLFAGLGVVCAVVGVAFIRVLYGSEDLADRIWRGPEWLRPAAGGLLLGLLLLALPELYGVGYPQLEGAIRGRDVIGLLLLLLVGKMIATSVTIAIGGSGGVFAPSLFMGAMLGTAYGDVIHHLAPGFPAAPAGTYGLIGMGAVFAAAARAPITAVIIIFELTGDYRIILPLMLAIALAVAASRLISRDTIYTLKLRRRGIEIDRNRGPDVLGQLRVASAMQPVPLVLSTDSTVRDAAGILAESPVDGVPILDGDGDYVGTVTAERLERALQGDGDEATLAGLADPDQPLHTTQTVRDALHALLRSEHGLPVVDETGALAGWLSHSDVLQAYTARVTTGTAVASVTPLPQRQEPRSPVAAAGRDGQSHA